MRKLISVSLVCAMVFGAAITVNATEIPETCHVNGCRLGECFTDADCDGICGDHYFVDENGDGVCDNHCYLDENADGICDYFADADEDGICDHCHEHGKPAQSDGSAIENTTDSNTVYHYGGHHRSHHRRGGRHHGRHC